MNNLYLVVDTDMHFTWGLYRSLKRVLAEATQLMQEAGYKSFTVEQDEEEWYITFNHDIPDCVGHWHVEHVKVED